MKTMTITRGIMAAAASLLVMTAASCTVIEDRQPCPCFLTVGLDHLEEIQDGASRGGAYASIWNPAPVKGENVKIKGSSFLEFEVPKGDAVFSLVTGINGMKVDGNTLTIPAGSQCDSLYGFVANLDCNGETQAVEPVMHKNFATVRMTMSCDPGETYTYSLRVRGSWAGIDLRDLSPVRGEFEYIPAGKGEQGNVFSARVPRQGDDSLQLDIMRPDGTLRTVDLGTMIAQEGFSWMVADLGDLFLDIDHDAVVTGIRIIPWTDEPVDFIEED